MKAIRIISAIILGIIFILACEREQTPERVAEQFLNYLEKGEFDKVKELGTSNTHKIIETMEAIDELGNQFGETEKYEHREISNIECVTDGDRAVCTYKADDEVGELDLIKKDGEWLVDMKKESPFDEASYEEKDTNYQ